MALSKHGDRRLVCEVAERLRATYSIGIFRKRVEELGVGDFNRAVSPKYVHHLAYNYTEIHGFTRFRYKNAIALEPRPDDPTAAARRTNLEAASSDGLLPTVPLGELLHMATKSHLLL